jgi:uncharacterized protein (DUF58 family)
VSAAVIPDDLAQDIRSIELRVDRRIRSLRVGSYTSPLRGEGFEFDQHRPYRHGDDVRRIDWNATARIGSPFLRQTRAERELQMVLVGDLSRSMQFGSGRSKHDAMVLATACLLFSALASEIRSGVLGFTDSVLEWTSPVADKPTAWAALMRLWALEPPGRRTAIRPAVRHLLETLKRTTLVILLSDFVTDEDLRRLPELSMLAARHDVVAVVLEDPAETRLPAGAGYVRVRDVEANVEMTVGLSDEVRDRFAAAVEQRRAELRDGLYQCGVDHEFVNTQRDLVEPLMRVFERRRG